MLVFNQGMKDMLKQAVDSHDYDSKALAMMKLVKILKREIFEWGNLLKVFHLIAKIIVLQL